MKRVHVAVFVLLSAAYPIVDADETWGKWQDENGANIYEFLGNHEFRFHGIELVWVPQQGWSGSLFQNFPRARQPRGQHMQERKEFVGAWESGDKVCYGINDEGGKVVGNLKLYVSSVECCMEAKRLGPTLILRALNGEKASPEKTDGKPEVCVNRALRQVADEKS